MSRYREPGSTSRASVVIIVIFVIIFTLTLIITPYIISDIIRDWVDDLLHPIYEFFEDRWRPVEWEPME